MRNLLLVMPLVLNACGSAESRPAPTALGSPAHPVVIELFQSQGCSSCPPANANVNAVAETRPDVLALSFAVTYWDRLGWKDRFASPAFTARQWDYARAGGRAQVATPQVIVNGIGVVNGGDRAGLDQAIAAAGPAKGGPAIEPAGARIHLGAGTAARPATVWLVRYDPAVRAVPVRAGENQGKTLPHRNIVRQLVRLGEWRGAAADYVLPAPTEPRLATAVLVQQGQGGPITAARKL